MNEKITAQFKLKKKKDGLIFYAKSASLENFFRRSSVYKDGKIERNYTSKKIPNLHCYNPSSTVLGWYCGIYQLHPWSMPLLYEDGQRRPNLSVLRAIGLSRGIEVFIKGLFSNTHLDAIEENLQKGLNVLSSAIRGYVHPYNFRTPAISVSYVDEPPF